jgi:hypothetical protein
VRSVPTSSPVSRARVGAYTPIAVTGTAQPLRCVVTERDS